MVEVLVLSVFGGAGAVLLTGWLTRLCSEVLTRGSLGIDYGVRVDGRVLAFALAASLAIVLLSALCPPIPRGAPVSLIKPIGAG